MWDFSRAPIWALIGWPATILIAIGVGAVIYNVGRLAFWFLVHLAWVS